MAKSLCAILALLLNPVRSEQHAKCTPHTLDFVMLEGDATQAAIEDDIRAELAKIGVTVNARALPKADFNVAMTSGDFHMCFSETWGAPYDPVSYLTGWMANDEAHYSAMSGVTGDYSRDKIFAKTDLALAEHDPVKRAKLWHDIHTMVHKTAVNMPLWGKSIHSVLNQRLGGYMAGHQQFDYPVDKIVVQSGSKTVTVAPGGQTGLFTTVGRLDPHSYRPNEFFANNWVYEGLVSYGADGAIVPALAESWTETADGKGMIFKLRTGVKFHDGEDWNCAVAKQNFDHFFAAPMRTADWHGWYKLPFIVTDWSCNDAGDFVLKTSTAYSNLLQELTFIRPSRMLSPASFMPGTWQTNNSCPTGWGEITDGTVTITCGGIKNPIGTGPFKFVARIKDGDNDAEVHFARHDTYWKGPPDIEMLKIIRYKTADAVAAALLDGSLDMVVGNGVLKPKDLTAFMANSKFRTFKSPVLMHSIVIINSGKAPTNDLALRKAIIHGVDKASIIAKELDGMAEAVDCLFPRSAPYSDVELTPRWDYDMEKATILNCAPSPSPSASGYTHIPVTDQCNAHTLDFVMLEGDATQAAIEDDIRAELAPLGFTVNARALPKADFNVAMTSGDFHMCFSETWGAPYDPVSYLTGWMANDEAHYSAMSGVTGANSRDKIFAKTDLALAEHDPAKRAKLWHEIHNMVHQTAVNLPLWGQRIHSVLNQRLGGYHAGYQQFDYPVDKIVVQSGSKTVTVAPGGQTGLFTTVGRLDPHSYRPNEFFANNWVYEGLVSYGADGAIVPALAESWTETADGKGLIFKLRTGVKFHDGEDWNCAVAKQNFDHFFAAPMRTADWHGWYKLPFIVTDWSCNDAGDFVLKTSTAYANLLQELTFIRPSRMLSPASFMPGTWQTNNSCPTGWGEITDGTVTITCGGIKNPIGTGPFKFVARIKDGDNDAEVHFARHDTYWKGPPDIEMLKIIRYKTADAVAAALLDGSLDMVVGNGVLKPADLTAFMTTHASKFYTFKSSVLMHSVIILNSGKAPTDDSAVRKSIIHGVDKAAIIAKELDGLADAADRLFPRSAPYSNVELTPRWDYDMEKSMMLNCPPPAPPADSEEPNAQEASSSISISYSIAIPVIIYGVTGGFNSFFKY